MEYLFKLLTYFLPFIKKFLQRPIIDVEVLKGGSKSKSLGISNKDLTQDFANADETIRVYEVNFVITLTIWNNSEYTAYYPKVYYEKKFPHLKVTPLDSIIPIESNKNVEMVFEITDIFESLPRNRRITEKEREQLLFKQQKLLVEYKNSKRVKYYTLFDFEKKKNIPYFKKPKRYKWIEFKK